LGTLFGLSASGFWERFLESQPAEKVISLAVFAALIAVAEQ
jgi:hypothetical protein